MNKSWNSAEGKTVSNRGPGGRWIWPRSCRTQVLQREESRREASTSVCQDRKAQDMVSDRPVWGEEDSVQQAAQRVTERGLCFKGSSQWKGHWIESEFPLLALAKWSWEKLVYLGFSFLTCKTEFSPETKFSAAAEPCVKKVNLTIKTNVRQAELCWRGGHRELLSPMF